MQKKAHFVSASCRAQHPGKQEASKQGRKKSPILLALVVVLNILENKKPANHAAKKAILLALVVVLNILENKKPANNAEKKTFC